ncbi:hypothetical protein TIFTF001_001524 [Ficus carica]|uniref:Uncharacterized protein n=1 Tax=Ficus carica TaxID=3494 RepID=A0AA87ZN46_FICCA|nr:hypothetical protein TIFTF001_001524 [Ficus carica]
MSSRRGGGKAFASGTAANGSSSSSSSSSSSKGKNVAAADPTVEQLSHGVADVSLQSAAQDDGEWEVISRKSKNKAGNTAAKQQWIPQNSTNKTTWGYSDASQKTVGARNNDGLGNSWSTKAAVDPRRSAGRGNIRPQAPTGFDNGYKAASAQPVIRPPLEHGWNWSSRPGAQQPKTMENTAGKENVVEDDDSDALDDVDDDDDDDADELLSDEFDSDSSEKSHGTLKKSKWFVKFFKIIDELQINEVTNPERQWHCPACQGGPGAIDWYRGMQPLLTHAKTKGGDRMKVHRKLAELLEEELKRKGTSVVPPGEAFGRWKGVKDDEKDYEIVWPPMVMIMNTQLETDENEKWIGMGNQELLEYFITYHPMKARHSYGPHGHRGMSVLIFEASARGYHEAERLHKHFVDQGRDRNAWRIRNRRGTHYEGGKRLLYGFLTVKEDLDVFNQHSQGKSKLKYDLRSHHEMVTSQIRQMTEDNQQLGWYKDKLIKKDMHAKALEESLDIVSQKLRQTMKENRIVRLRTKMQHEENKEEREKAVRVFLWVVRVASHTCPFKNWDRFIELQEKEMEEYVEEREALIKAHQEEMNAAKREFWERQVELEKQFNAELTRLMDKYSPSPSSKNAADS